MGTGTLLQKLRLCLGAKGLRTAALQAGLEGAVGTEVGLAQEQDGVIGTAVP